MDPFQIDPPFSRHRVSNQRKVCRIHYHDKHELYYLVRGTTKYIVGDEIFFLEPGNFILIPKGSPHGTDSESCLHNERVLLSFDDASFDPEARTVLAGLFEEKQIFLPENQLYQAEDLFRKLEEEDSGPLPGSGLMTRLYIQQLLLLLYRLQCPPTAPEDPDRQLIREVSQYISAHFSQDLSLRTLGSRFAISESGLSRKFKAVSGMGVREYINHVRIHHAALLLAQTDASVTDVSLACGFNDSNYFASVFKKAKGSTPYKYAKSFRTP